MRLTLFPQIYEREIAELRVQMEALQIKLNAAEQRLHKGDVSGQGSENGNSHYAEYQDRRRALIRAANAAMNISDTAEKDEQLKHIIAR